MTSRRQLHHPYSLAELEVHELASLAEARPRQLISTRGEVALTELLALGSSHAWRCLLRDGTGSLSLLFMGRRKVAGLYEGVWCRAAGRVAVHESELVLWNPSYHIEPPRPAPGEQAGDTPSL